MKECSLHSVKIIFKEVFQLNIIEGTSCPTISKVVAQNYTTESLF